MSSAGLKILALDIDGVLNDHAFRDVAKSATLKRECVEQLNRIIHETGCHILLTSAWRYIILLGDMTTKGFEYMLRTHGVTEKVCIIGHTAEDGPDLGADRGAQVRSWLEGFEVTSSVAIIVVVDDMDLGFSGSPFAFVQPNGRVGLTASDANRIIELMRIYA
jgi:hypothetical protein